MKAHLVKSIRFILGHLQYVQQTDLQETSEQRFMTSDYLKDLLLHLS